MNKSTKKGCTTAFGIVFGIIAITFVLVILIPKDKGIKIDQTEKKIEVSEIVKDFSTLPEEQIFKKYGKPIETIYQNSSDEWVLNKKDRVRAMIFYSDSTKTQKETIRFFNIKLGMLWYQDLNWDLADVEVNKPGKYDLMKGLNGIDEAMWKHQQNTLNIKLSGKGNERFGKK